MSLHAPVTPPPRPFHGKLDIILRLASTHSCASVLHAHAHAHAHTHTHTSHIAPPATLSFFHAHICTRRILCRRLQRSTLLRPLRFHRVACPPSHTAARASRHRDVAAAATAAAATARLQPQLQLQLPLEPVSTPVPVPPLRAWLHQSAGASPPLSAIALPGRGVVLVWSGQSRSGPSTTCKLRPSEPTTSRFHLYDQQRT